MTVVDGAGGVISG